MEKLKEFISTIELPIHIENTNNPKQLVLTKNGEYISSYDPVWKLEVDGEELKVTGWLNRVYSHKLGEFDTIQIYKYLKDKPYRKEDVLQTFSFNK
jgi:hypothetical protein